MGPGAAAGMPVSPVAYQAWIGRVTVLAPWSPKIFGLRAAAGV